MLNRLPDNLPSWNLMLDDIGAPSSRQVAKKLQVSERRVRAWCKSDDAPHLARLSVYWLTRWGQSAVNAEAVNLSDLHVAMARCAGTELASARRKLAHLERIADFGCANMPLETAVCAAGHGAFEAYFRLRN